MAVRQMLACLNYLQSMGPAASFVRDKMKRLILMRHAKLDWSGSQVSDHDRPLNESGRVNSTSLGLWMSEKALKPDVVLCSSAARTRETLDLLQLSGSETLKVTRALYLADAEELFAAIKEVSGDTVLVIAHNPSICDIAEMIVDAPPNPDGIRHYPTGATVVATFDIDRWTDMTWRSGHITHIVRPSDLPPPE
jgi:phosphohistidine phosphatase